MRVFIDLGCYTGDTIAEAIVSVAPCAQYLGFEPIPDLFLQCKKRFSKDKRVKILNLGIDKEPGKKKLYLDFYSETKTIGMGSTLMKSKSTGRIKRSVQKGRYLIVKCIDISKYIVDNFKLADYLILKIDIEGKEYDVLEQMIASGSIRYIRELYCEWHKDKMSGEIPEERHNGLISQLSALFPLSGLGRQDAFEAKDIV